MTSGIYKLTSPSGKSYIGQSVDLNKRLNSYSTRGAKGQTLLEKAFFKYGWTNFKIDILCVLDEPEEDLHRVLDELETYYIEMHDTLCPNGYNLTAGGKGTIYSQKALNKNGFNFRNTKGEVVWDIEKELPKKYRVRKKKAPMTEETKRKLSASLKGIMLGIKQSVSTCPYCGKSGGNAFKAWHFDKCKQKPRD